MLLVNNLHQQRHSRVKQPAKIVDKEWIAVPDFIQSLYKVERGADFQMNDYSCIPKVLFYFACPPPLPPIHPPYSHPPNLYQQHRQQNQFMTIHFTDRNTYGYLNNTTKLIYHLKPTNLSKSYSIMNFSIWRPYNWKSCYVRNIFLILNVELKQLFPD